MWNNGSVFAKRDEKVEKTKNEPEIKKLDCFLGGCGCSGGNSLMWSGSANEIVIKAIISHKTIDEQLNEKAPTNIRQ